MVTEIGEVGLRVPRDRAGTFEPVTVPKYQRRLDGLSGNVISLYAKGLTTGDIQQHLEEIYGTEVSRETISKITDRVVDDMIAWQSRPLDPLYAVLVIDCLVIDCLVIEVRGSQVANRPVYVAVGVNLDGERDVLGLWLGPSGGCAPSFCRAPGVAIGSMRALAVLNPSASSTCQRIRKPWRRLSQTAGRATLKVALLSSSVSRPVSD